MRGMGRIYKQRRSRFYWIAYYVSGREVRESCHSEKRSAATRLLKRRLSEIHGGTYVGPSQERVPFTDLLDAVERDYVLNNRRDLSMLRYRLKRLKETFPLDRAMAVTTQRIERFKEELLAEGKKPATINRFLSVIRRAFRLGLKQKLVSAMPTVEALREDNVREGFLEPKDFEAVLKHLPEEIQGVARFAYVTGWRRREVTRLQWKDVDTDNWSLVLPGRNSKNYRRRTVPLEGELRLLVERWATARSVKRPDGTVALSEHVFHRAGAEIKDFRATWNKACTEAGFPGTFFHDLRRSGARNLVRAGVPERVVMTLTGHLTRSIFDRYNIVDDRDLRDALRKADAYLEKKLREKDVANEEHGYFTDTLTPEKKSRNRKSL